MVVAELLPLLLLLAAYLVLTPLQSLFLPPLCITPLLEAVGLETPDSPVLPGGPVVYKVEGVLLQSAQLHESPL